MKRTTSDSTQESVKRIKNGSEQGSSDSESESESNLEYSQSIDTNSANHGLGTIEYISLTNFMCHSRLELSLGPKLNFITGQNGSGKSAVLTALTVALGGKATFTNRASSIGNLLKEGQDIGEVIVKIRNKGPDAYKPDVYGDTITVVRTIVRTGLGTSGYKIKGQSGRIISTKHEDLQAICDHLQIEVANPMAILTQDNARGFLSNSTPKDKYNFFLRGTQLEKLAKDYKQFDDKMEQIQISLQKKSEDMEKAKDMEARVNELQAEQIWSKVELLENKTDKQRQNKDNVGEKIKEVTVRIDRINESLQGYQLVNRKLRKQLDDEKSTLTPLTDEEKSLIQNLQQQKNLIIEQKRLKEPLLNDINECKESQSQVIYRYDQEMKKLNVDHRAQRDAHDQKMKDYEMKKEDNIARQSQITNDIQLLEEEGEDMNRNRLDLERELNQAENTYRHSTQRLRELEASSRDSINSYGQGMSQLLRDINSKRWKGNKPIGPFDSKFHNLIETYLNSQLNSFAVETQDDIRELQSLINRHRVKSQIYKYSNVSNFDFSTGQPSRNLRTMLDALQIDNDIVLQQLIITASIEKVVLVDSHADGDDIAARGYPENVVAVFSSDCYQFGSRNGGLSSDPMTMYRGSPRLTHDFSVIINEQKEVVELQKAAVQKLRYQLDQVHSKLGDIGRRRETLIIQRCTLERETREIELNLESLRGESPEAEMAVLETLSGLKKENEHKIEGFESQLGLLEDQINQLVMKYKDDRVILQNIRDQIAKKNEALNAIVTQLDENDTGLAKGASQIQFYENKKASYQAEYDEAEGRLQELQQTVATQIDLCLQYGDRVAVTKSPEEIEAELRKVRAFLKEKEKEFGSKQAYYTKLVAKRKAYQEARDYILGYEKLMEYIHRVQRKRRKRYEAFKQYISTRAKRLFAELIKKRGYRGVLELDHDQETLHLKVDVNNNGLERSQSADDVDKRDPKTLSGGEKSYSTVCLLLALWESMSSPFRALDEFDVYMDAVNRRLAIGLMVENAREPDNSSQYILITPQNMTHISGSDLRILKMQPPERNQPTIDFTRAQ
ncbi:Structural maintenance of chromosomes protein 6 [Globomyces sp. JEL0801]|nr:Structural maintenance of chromosomes protein 6 [Globomyces sp. JEL0801]